MGKRETGNPGSDDSNSYGRPRVTHMSPNRFFMNEVDDPTPSGCLCFVPEAGTSGCDPGVRRDTGHLREDEARAAHRARAQMNKVEIVGYAVLGARHLLRHGDHLPVARQLGH